MASSTKNLIALFFIFLLGDLFDAFHLNNIEHMNVDDIDQVLDLKTHLLAKNKLGGFLFQNKKVLGSSFKWNKCTKAASLLNLEDLVISPDPLHFPGNVGMKFNASIKKTLDGPLPVDLTLKKQIEGSFWLEIPCIEGIGSCKYDDLCDVLKGATCPRPFVKYNIPCKCPFDQGSYKMQNSTINVNVNAIPTGNYYAKASISLENELVSCIEVYFTIA